MNRSTLATTIAAFGLTMFATAQIQADGHNNNGAAHRTGSGARLGVTSGHRGEVGHSFRANGRFEYGRHGFKSLSWTRYGWSDRYRTYCYWEPRYGWCFYEPTYSCYLPIGYYREVYPQAVLTAAPEVPVREIVRQSPAVVQQTSVIVGAPAGPAVDLPIPPVGPPVGPNPGALQQTRVNAGVP
jgi:hypothetical protein